MSEETAVAAEGTEETQAGSTEQPGHETFTTKAMDGKTVLREIELTWNVGKDVNESIDIFGAEVVHGMFKKAIIVAVQANIRRMLEATKENSTDPKHSDDDIRNFVFNSYKPGVRSARTGAAGAKSMDKLVAFVLKLSQEDRAAFLADPKGFLETHK